MNDRLAEEREHAEITHREVRHLVARAASCRRTRREAVAVEERQVLAAEEERHEERRSTSTTSMYSAKKNMPNFMPEYSVK